MYGPYGCQCPFSASAINLHDPMIKNTSTKVGRLM